MNFAEEDIQEVGFKESHSTIKLAWKDDKTNIQSASKMAATSTSFDTINPTRLENIAKTNPLLLWSIPSPAGLSFPYTTLETFNFNPQHRRGPTAKTALYSPLECHYREKPPNYARYPQFLDCQISPTRCPHGNLHEHQMDNILLHCHDSRVLKDSIISLLPYKPQIETGISFQITTHN